MVLDIFNPSSLFYLFLQLFPIIIFDTMICIPLYSLYNTHFSTVSQFIIYNTMRTKMLFGFLLLGGFWYFIWQCDARKRPKLGKLFSERFLGVMTVCGECVFVSCAQNNIILAELRNQRKVLF